RSLGDVGEDGLEVEDLVQSCVGEKVQRGVEKREQPEHPPNPDRPRPTEDELQRRAGQGCDQKSQRQQAELVQRRGNRIRAELAPSGRCSQPEHREERADENGWLEPRERALPHGFCRAQKFALRSMPEQRLATCSPYPLKGSVLRLRNSPVLRAVAWLHRGWSTSGFTFA